MATSYALLGSHTYAQNTHHPHLSSLFSAEHTFYFSSSPSSSPPSSSSSCVSILRRKTRKPRLICSCAKPILEELCFNHEVHWREEVLSALQRSLLESQWAEQITTQSSQRFEEEEEEAKVISNVEDNAFCMTLRSGMKKNKLSARERRLSARMKTGVFNNKDMDMTSSFTLISSSSSSPLSSSTSSSSSLKRKGKMKLEPLHDFVSSFLRPAAGCGMFTKDEEQGFTKQMRIHQSLEKARRKLKRKLGYDPSYETLAQSVQVSTPELILMLAVGEVARNMMLVSHLRLVVSVARQYQNLGLDTADLIQEGSRGLLRGLDRFDHRRGHKISTYVHWWIRQGITRAIADHSRIMRVPVYLHEIIFAMKRAKAQLKRQGKPITVENLAIILNVPNSRIKRALLAKSRVISIDKTSSPYDINREFSGLHEFVADKNTENQPWELLFEQQTRENMMTRLRLLTAKEQKIIRWLFGIDTKDGAWSSLQSVGNKVGVSKERVRQIKMRALRKMRSVGGETSL